MGALGIDDNERSTTSLLLTEIVEDGERSKRFKGLFILFSFGNVFLTHG